MRRVDVPPGTVFGRLTIIEEASQQGDRRMMLCQCECGTRKIVEIGKLRSGHTRSCGCLNREASAERARTRPRKGQSADTPPGTVFGMLTVTGITRDANGRPAMLCRCECGGTKTATITALRRGAVKSCGCINQGMVVPPGTVFGRLTVIEEAPRQGARGLRAMLCRCECGTVKAADLNGLRGGRITSCGCARREALRRVDVPSGTVFGLFTVIKEVRLPVGKSTRRAMLCQCACGKQKTVLLASLRTGRSRSCGCLRQEVQASDVARLNPGEVPLYGKRARGRVAYVDLEDYGLVMQYRWHVLEHDPAAPGRRPHGPYAAHDAYQGGRGGTRVTIYMHQLVAGAKGVDHIDGNGLNNRKSNLRPASKKQNMANSRKNPGKTSRYKGVFWDRRRSRWVAHIAIDGISKPLGRFDSEEDAGLTYDIAAREAFGEFALTNFADVPTQEMRANLQARREADRAAMSAQRGRKISAARQQWWAERAPVTYTCTVCEAEFQSTAVHVLYCSGKCKQQGYAQQERERQQEGRLF